MFFKVVQEVKEIADMFNEDITTITGCKKFDEIVNLVIKNSVSNTNKTIDFVEGFVQN